MIMARKETFVCCFEKRKWRGSLIVKKGRWNDVGVSDL
jgi:hypothetical protein